MAANSRDYLVGLFSFVGIVIICILVLLYGEEPTVFLTTHYDLAVVVDNPTGIGEGTPAFMQGVQVGRVREIRFQDSRNPSQGAAVIVAVDEEYTIPRGSLAAIHPQFGFDKGAIHINPPTIPSEPLPKKQASIIGEMRGALDSIVPEEFVPTLVQAVERIGQMAGEIRQLANRFGVVSEDLHDLLQVRTTDVVDSPDQEAAANVYTAVQRLDRTLKLLNRFIEEDGDLRATTSSLRDAAHSLREWSGTLEDRTAGLAGRADTTLQNIDRRFSEMSARLVSVLGDLSGLLDQASAVLTASNQGQGTVAKLVHDPKLYEELIDSLQQLQLLIADLRAAAAWLTTESRLAPGKL